MNNEIELHNKKEIIQYLKECIEELKSHPEILKGHSVQFLGKLIYLLNEFLEEIKITYFPDIREDGWLYFVEVKEYAIKLSLKFVGYPNVKDEYLNGLYVAESFDLVEQKCDLLTVEQYASIYNVADTTVRQWIRRGKLRSAIKFGNEWRIPELCEVGGRGFTSAYYMVTGYIEKFDEKYSFINDYCAVGIVQDEIDKDNYYIIFYGEDFEDNKELSVDKKERERLELLLISNPFIEYDNDPIIGNGM